MNTVKTYLIYLAPLLVATFQSGGSIRAQPVETCINTVDLNGSSSQSGTNCNGTGPQFCETVKTKVEDLSDAGTTTKGQTCLGVKVPGMGGVQGCVNVESSKKTSISGSVIAPVSSANFQELCRNNCPLPEISGAASVKCELSFKVGAGYSISGDFLGSGFKFEQSQDGTIKVSAEETVSVSAKSCSVGDLRTYLAQKKEELDRKKNQLCDLANNWLKTNGIITRNPAAMCGLDSDCTRWARDTCAANQYIGKCLIPRGGAAAICDCKLPAGAECGIAFLPCSACQNGVRPGGSWPFTKYFCR